MQRQVYRVSAIGSAGHVHFNIALAVKISNPNVEGRQSGDFIWIAFGAEIEPAIPQVGKLYAGLIHGKTCIGGANLAVHKDSICEWNA